MKLTIASLALVASIVEAAYTVLQESYTPANFFSKFDFYTAADPTNGFVKYIDQASALSQGLIRTNTNNVYIGVDYTNSAPNGRSSVRLESKARFQRGLFILDLAHMPAGVCGTWPAYWTLGDNWPNNGEIDIIEGVHQNTQNLMALHTSDGCTITATGQTGTSITKNCYVNAAGQSSNQGCSTQDTRTNSYGTGFNNIGGGVYATEWNSDFIKVWFFPRSAIPADALSGNPEPASWGTPAAIFQGSCDINSKFNSHRIIFDVTFCGDWAGSVWSTSGCPGSSCIDYVANTPGAFAPAYWQINSLKVWSS